MLYLIVFAAVIIGVMILTPVSHRREEEQHDLVERMYKDSGASPPPYVVDNQPHVMDVILVGLLGVATAFVVLAIVH